MASTAERGLHVLYVAWGFAPHRGPGAYRPLATVNSLIEHGHRVTVLTADLDTFAIHVGGDLSLLEHLHPDATVVRVPMRQDVRDPIINRWPLSRARNQRQWSQLTVETHERGFPEAVYAPWGPRAIAVAARLHEQDPFDLTLATGNPYVDFSVALSLSSEFGVPYVLDDRDSWILDVYTGDELPLASRIRPWLETAMEGALEVWFVNPPIADWHRQAFPAHAHKVQVVENGWDTLFLPPEKLAPRPSNRDRLIFSYVGTINPRLPIRLMAEAWREARRRSELVATAELRVVGHFGYAGTMTPEQAAIRAEFDVDDVTFPGRQPKDQIAEAYVGADVLVFAKEGSHLVTSGKVYEYVASGRPIVAMVEREHDARRVLDGYPRLHDAEDLTVPAVADAMVRAADDAVRTPEVYELASAFGARYRRDVVLAEALVRTLTRLGR